MPQPKSRYAALANAGCAFSPIAAIAAVAFGVLAFNAFAAAGEAATPFESDIHIRTAWWYVGAAIGVALSGFFIDAVVNWMNDMLKEVTQIRSAVEKLGQRPETRTDGPPTHHDAP